MIKNIKDIYGTKLAALDGEIGEVKDFYFDDVTWAIRYLVVDTGTWLSSRLVLLSPHLLGKLDDYGKILHVKLHKKQIESSPSTETHKPVSRQDEIDYYRYYGLPAYWNGDALWGVGGYPSVLPRAKDALEAAQDHKGDDPHLRSTKGVTGYAIHATDGEIGVVSGFTVDDRSWAMGEMAVQTGHWYSGREILIATSMIGRIDYEASEVHVNVSKSAIERTAGHQVVTGGAWVRKVPEDSSAGLKT
ncbi:MAG: PRC-barrel domain-containing protein [Lacunisphaera sp.]